MLQSEHVQVIYSATRWMSPQMKVFAAFMKEVLEEDDHLEWRSLKNRKYNPGKDEDRARNAGQIQRISHTPVGASKETVIF